MDSGQHPVCHGLWRAFVAIWPLCGEIDNVLATIPTFVPPGQVLNAVVDAERPPSFYYYAGLRGPLPSTFIESLRMAITMAREEVRDGGCVL